MRVFIFKPDGIGDFVLMTGALRVLADACGEDHLSICVRPLLVPLARSQFPRATVIELPTAAERKIVNLFARNFVCCLPLWYRLRTTRFDAAVCFRSMRNYLETFLFYSANADRHVACENLLLRSGRKVRTAVERSVARIFRADLAPYPAGPCGLPLEIEANRVLVERVLARSVGAEEILPQLRCPGTADGSYWILAPVTNLKTKVYPFPRWRDLLAGLGPEALERDIRLAGAENDRPLLEEMLGLLRGAGFTGAKIETPPDLVAYVDLIAGAGLMLTVDTAAAHFATALDKRTVVLFSGLHRGMFAP
ncbi:MAG TPA: glycosyltransferase family 9 protein, partial [Terrimicrobiaceae bacterium]|nr:glycosyltransferase family 9 protein [Terrimicrobiaceae bacterium]